MGQIKQYEVSSIHDDNGVDDDDDVDDDNDDDDVDNDNDSDDDDDTVYVQQALCT